MAHDDFHRKDLDFSPWTFWAEADEDTRDRQLDLQRDLVAKDGYELGEGCFVSSRASVRNDRLRLGDRTYVAAGAYLTGELEAGRDCSVNAYSVVRGRVSIGDAVRIGAHTSILGFNHSMDDPDVEVFRQPMRSRGITIGDDVWIGSHVVVLDGVTVGRRAVLAAGAVVTKDVPAGAVVGGNPARVLRWRTTSEDAREDVVSRLAVFGEKARESGPALLDRAWDSSAGLFRDRPGAEPTVRAQCDAIELGDLLTGRPPEQLSADEQTERLRGRQDPATGLVGEMGSEASFADHPSLYHVLSVGYALDLLGSAFPEPVHALPSADATLRSLRALPWRDQAWTAGAWVDAIGTACLWNRRHGVETPAYEALLGWLVTNADPDTGLWGARTPAEGLRQPVNGFYRASRGTFAQFGVPLPYPERVIDSVLQHARDVRFFAPERFNACNLLDVAHPLWLTRPTGYRREEVLAVARRFLGTALGLWVDGAGFGFAARTVPGLQGTEMWLAVIWYLADLLGQSDDLGYRPRGVHRPEPRTA